MNDIFYKQLIKESPTGYANESENLHYRLLSDDELRVVTIRDIAQQKTVREDLQENKNFFATLLESIPAPVFYKDVEGRYLGCNRAFEEFYGKTKTELIGKNVFDISPVELARVYHAKDVELFIKPGTQTYETQVKTARGLLCDVIIHKATITNSQEEVTGLIGVILDITDRKKLEKALENERKLLETTLISVVDGVISTDNYGNIVFLNRVAEFLTGWTQEGAIGKSIEEVFNIVNESTQETSKNIVKKVLESGKTFEFTNNTILISKDGIKRPIEDSVAPIIQENGEIVGVVFVFRDVTEKKKRQKEIEFLSFRDQLTGLYNRNFFEAELSRLDTERNLHLSLVYADVNGLKLANDAFGHSVGDKVLQRVAEVLKKQCRANDIIARIGGDEFVILLPKTTSEETNIIINRIKKDLAKEKVDAISLSVSFGWKTKRHSDEKITDTLKKAEDRMYRNKLTESKTMRYKTFELIISTLHDKSECDKHHSERVSQLCVLIGSALSLSTEDIDELITTAAMHDIGKIAIDFNILNKPGKLNAIERIEIKRHPETGYHILRSLNEFSKIADYVLAHHERWDGKGYPKGLKGEDIPLISRIITVIDAFDAMTNNRPYRSKLSHTAAIEELKKHAGTQFDPHIAQVFIEKVLKCK